MTCKPHANTSSSAQPKPKWPKYKSLVFISILDEVIAKAHNKCSRKSLRPQATRTYLKNPTKFLLIFFHLCLFLSFTSSSQINHSSLILRFILLSLIHVWLHLTYFHLLCFISFFFFYQRCIWISFILLKLKTYC